MYYSVSYLIAISGIFVSQEIQGAIELPQRLTPIWITPLIRCRRSSRQREDKTFLIAVCDKRQRPHGCLLGRPEIQHTSARVSPHPSPALPLPAIPMGDPTAVEDGRGGRTVGESIFKTVPLPRNFQMAAPPHAHPPLSVSLAVASLHPGDGPRARRGSSCARSLA